MPDIKWTKKLSNKHGFTYCNTIWLPDLNCLKKSCFHPHDWWHDKRLVCIVNFRSGCPEKN